MIYLYLFGTCFHFIYVFMIIYKYFPLLFCKLIKNRGVSVNPNTPHSLFLFDNVLISSPESEPLQPDYCPPL